MARSIQTLAFIQGKGWVSPEATPEQEAERVAAYEAVVAKLKAAKGDSRAALKTELRRAHMICAQECMVEIGRGAIRGIDEGDRNSRVEIDADHLNDPIHGYIDMTDFTLWGQVAVIKTNFGRCRYRIIVRRQAEIHPSIGWNETPEADKSKRIRDLVMLAPDLAGAETFALPAPANPEAAASAHLAPASAALHQNPAGGSPAGGSLVCPLCGKPANGGGPVYMHSSGRYAHRVCPDGTPQPDAAPEPEGEAVDLHSAPSGAGLRVSEASISMVELAVELLCEHLVEVGQAGPPAVPAIKGLAGMLLDASDQAQQLVRAENVDRADDSHAWARGAVRVALRVYPVPFREDNQTDLATARRLWVSNLASYAAMLVQTAAELDCASRPIRRHDLVGR